MDQVDGTTDVIEAPIASAPEGEPISRAHATELIKREKDAAYRKAQREFNAQVEQMKTGQTQAMGGMQQPNEELINSAVDRKIQAMREQYDAMTAEQQKAENAAYVNDQAKRYFEKIDKSGSLADDFQEMSSRFKPDKFKSIFFEANNYENAPQIIYELGKNPEKLALIKTMMETDPDMAKIMVENLSKSIAFNSDALKNNKSAEPPLDRPRPSLAAGADNGQMSLADLKKASWLRG